MYARSERNLVQLNGSTTQNIGPGAYDVSNLERQTFESYAPFSSLTLRDNMFASANETPGPGYYDLNMKLAAKGGSTMANKSKRFAEKKEEIPGPGSYTVENKENRQSFKKEYKRVSIPKVKINRKKNPPSIQDPKNAYGFEEGADGELVPQAPPDKDPSIGPAYYNILHSAPSTNYKGIHFSKYASRQWNQVAKASGPGPGEYDIIEPVKIDIEHYHMKGNQDKKPELNIPRFTEMITKNVERESIPGPGRYEQKRLFDNAAKANEVLGVEIERPPFGTQSRRFDNFKTLAPGPGAYNDQRNAFESIAKLHSLKQTPFMQSSVRFDSDNVYKVRSAPGPGQYRINGFAEDILRKAIIDSRRKPGFNQSAPRKFSLTKKDEYTKPGPANYQIVDKPFKSRKDQPTSTFASTSKQRELLVEDTPGPTAYNVSTAFDNLIHYKREPPRTKLALKRQESFNVVAKREFNLASTSEMPGPASYDVESINKTSMKVSKQTDRRWKYSAKENRPGPADYELSPMYQDTLLKGTFNATLNNPLVLKRNKSVSDPAVATKNDNLGFNNFNKVNQTLKAT